jgi:hypothetical protein
MKKITFALAFALAPAVTFAGGFGMDLSKYQRAPLANVQTNVPASFSSTEQNYSRAIPQRVIPQTRTYSPTSYYRSNGYRNIYRNNTQSYRLNNSMPRAVVYTLAGQEYATPQSLTDAYNHLDRNLSAYDFNGRTYASFAQLSDAMTSTLRANGAYFLDGELYANYWSWVAAYRAQNNQDTGVTRSTTSYRNYGNAYDLSTGLEPIDPQENHHRNESREDARQSAAQMKMWRLRNIGR